MKKMLRILTVLMILVTAVSLWVTSDKPSKPIPESGKGEASIGGAFALTDQEGRQVRDSDFRGKVMLVFFGFTHCPDICPVSSATLSSVMEKLADKADRVTPVFITVDPARDTPEVMKEYFSRFDKRIVALTGTQEQIAEAASAYKVYFSREAPASGHGDHGGHDMAAPAGENYMVNHSGFIYMMGTDGKYVRHFPYDASPDEITRAIEEYVKG